MAIIKTVPGKAPVKEHSAKNGRYAMGRGAIGRLAAGSVASLLAVSMLAGCGSSGATAGSAAATTAAATTTAATAAATGETTAAAAATTAASGPYNLRVVDWSDSSKVQREAFDKLFEEKHPGITVEYTCLTVDQFKNTIVTMIKSGDGPDLFPIPAGMTLATALGESWYQPMTPYLDEAFLGTLEDYALQEGFTTSGGELYALPEIAPIISNLFYYNQDVLDKAGVTKLPTTWSEFVATCKQVTEAGNGEFYGLIEGGQQANRVESLMRSFVGASGGKIAPFSKALTVDGRAPYDSKEMIAAFDMLAQLTADGSIHPDTVNIAAPIAREMFAQGQAAFLNQGMWCIATWNAKNPDLNYGVMAVPVQDGTSGGGVQGTELAPWMGIYSQSKNPAVAAEFLKALFSEEYGYQSACVANGNFVSIVKGVNEKAMTNKVMKQYHEIALQQTRAIPSITARDAAFFGFYTEVKDVTPNLANIAQGVLSGSITDYKSELAKLADAATAEWKRACEAKGLDFTKMQFDNWDATKDYTKEDYAALK